MIFSSLFPEIVMVITLPPQFLQFPFPEIEALTSALLPPFELKEGLTHFKLFKLSHQHPVHSINTPREDTYQVLWVSHHVVKHRSEEYWRQAATRTPDMRVHKSTHTHTHWFGRRGVQIVTHRHTHAQPSTHTRVRAHTHLFPALPLMSFCELGPFQQQGIVGELIRA